ncbi:ABC transporter substrate-binding protein [Streptacidiphilus albus]|uniref:ABC transporter substrate-binding protein n=1 Tax=Streptacidiphilus albus TaxID=105425 RepID=UPI0005A8AABC|nr:ABC transporter substrate-binding protein [Streptacidiphilus albus]
MSAPRPGAPRPTPRRPRRRLLATALAAVGALTASGCSGVANGGASSSSSAAAAAYRLTARTPAPAGDISSFTWSIFAEPTSIDYAQSYDYPPNQILANVCESLLRWNPDLTYSPSLATSYANPTPTTWVYQIRPGVHFHDGTLLTAHDVVVSLSRNMNPSVGSDWSYAYRNVKSIAQTGPMQVTVTLRSPDSTFNQYMATAPGTVESAATLAKDGTDYGNPTDGVNCTGPFEFSSWTPGQSLVLKRFDDYWDPQLRAKSAQVKFVFLSDPTARVNAFQTGEVDGGWMLPPDAFGQLESSKAGKLYFGSNTTVAEEVVNNLKGPLGNPTVRQALLMAIDRKGLIKAGVDGVGDVANAMVTPNTWTGVPQSVVKGYLDALPNYAYDPAKAKAMAAKAGVHGQTVVIATSPLDSETTISAQAVAQAATAIGLKPVIDTVSADKYTALFTDPAARQGIDLFVTFWYTNITDPLDMYSSLETGQFSNYGNWSDPAFDTALNKAVAAYDPAQHAADTAAAQQIAMQQLPWLPLYSEPVSVFLGNRITGLQPSIDYLYYPWAAQIGAKA